jgi:MOSC domain-containing protein YiiM
VSDGRVVSVNLADVRLILINGEPVKTGIFKLPTDERVAVGSEGLEGDRQVDRRVHGGPEKAVYAYGTGDYAWWSRELERETPPGLFGENLTVEGLDPSHAEIGECWRIGELLIEASEPRQPCSKLGAKMGDPRFVKRFARELRLGSYFRVLSPGEVGAGDEIEVVERPGHGVTAETLGRIAFGDRDLAERALRAEALGPKWREWLEGRRKRRPT